MMKKLLLTISFIILATNLRAQETTTDQIQDYKEYDFDAAKEYYLQGKPLSELRTQNDNLILFYYDIETGEYISQREFVSKYGKADLNTLKFLEKDFKKIHLTTLKLNYEKNKYNKYTQKTLNQYKNSNYKWRFNPTTTAVGGTLIGVSFAAFAVNAYANHDIDSQKTVGYVCAGVSVAGAICIIAGLHKEYYTRDGFKLANGLSVSDNGGGITITKKF